MRLVGKINCNDSFEADSALDKHKIHRSNKIFNNIISEFCYTVNSDEFFENCHRDYILLQKNKIKITFFIADSVKIAMNDPPVNRYIL